MAACSRTRLVTKINYVDALSRPSVIPPEVSGVGYSRRRLGTPVRLVRSIQKTSRNTLLHVLIYMQSHIVLHGHL